MVFDIVYNLHFFQLFAALLIVMVSGGFIGIVVGYYFSVYQFNRVNEDYEKFLNQRKNKKSDNLGKAE